MPVKKDNEIFFYTNYPKKYRFLGNFYPHRFVVDGIEYRSVEHYYQSQKARRESKWRWIKDAKTPEEAKRRGRSLGSNEMVRGWKSKRIQVMTIAMDAKFMQNKKLKRKLLATCDAPLHENSPTDLFWGVKGEDHAGKLLVKLRSRIRKGNL
jgi:ribA/ribD-fused uncharacterized protein